ncbi:hypothetical protein AVEN_73412-1 [Araneus ventricosus]|uniref:Uncharacterized protein n=1 Tax=Araneus ventricosus TaxID=182803 RepID=A0A4Y2PXD0_ARAVE|nr:hypothetical protein AVEN_73412-1 [Araneus ventricosus]
MSSLPSLTLSPYPPKMQATATRGCLAHDGKFNMHQIHIQQPPNTTTAKYNNRQIQQPPNTTTTKYNNREIQQISNSRSLDVEAETLLRTGLTRCRAK